MWLVGVVSRRQVWLVGEGGLYGCGCKEVYIDFLILLIPTTYLFFFAAASLLFVHFKKYLYIYMIQCIMHV